MGVFVHDSFKKEQRSQFDMLSVIARTTSYTIIFVLSHRTL